MTAVDVSRAPRTAGVSGAVRTTPAKSGPGGPRAPVSVPFAVFASGSGTNMQALLDHDRDGAAYRIELLITDRECAAEERARALGRAVRRVEFARGALSGSDAGPGASNDPAATPQDTSASELLRLLKRHHAEGILLAGFLRLVPARVCAAYRGRILNIHPALLPAFGGKGMYGHHVHEAVLRSGAALSGPTIHFVDERYDEGRIFAQWPVPVLPGDTPDALAARVLRVEHALYPAAADALARAVQGGWPSGGPGPAFCWPGDGRLAGVGSTAGVGPSAGHASSADAGTSAGAELGQRIIQAFGGTGD